MTMQFTELDMHTDGIVKSQVTCFIEECAACPSLSPELDQLLLVCRTPRSGLRKYNVLCRKCCNEGRSKSSASLAVDKWNAGQQERKLR